VGERVDVQTYVIEEIVGRGKKLQQYQRACGNMESLSGKLDLPADICEWVSPATLGSWVQEEVGKLTGDAPRTLLSVLSFAYARGIFDTDEILSRCESDIEFQKVSERAALTPEQLLGVRHKDRGLLVTLTVRLLSRAVVERCAVPASSFPPELKRRLHENAVDRLDNARHMDRGEAI
jgi:hypothetical protein